jgi:phage tail sheath gpL-like
MAVDISARARVVGIETEFKNLRAGQIIFLPQRIAVIGQGNSAAVYDTVKRQVTSAIEVANLYGFGSPVHLAARQLFPENGDGVGSIPVTIYPLEDDAGGVPSTGDVGATGTATESGTVFVKINNIRSEPITILDGEDGVDLEDRITDAINAVLEMPVTAVANAGTSVADLTSKWEGTSANGIIVEVEGTIAGLVFVITAMAGGLANPDVQDALDQVGDVWESLILNCMDIADTTTLGLFDIYGEGLWGSLRHSPTVVFTGNTATTPTAATAVSDARKPDRTNSQLVAPGSNDLPFVVAARQLARIAPVANNNPPQDYAGQKASGLTPGLDGVQWTFVDRDFALKKGSSSIEVKDGVINLSDTITFFHPDGEIDPAYRYVADIVKIQNILFNTSLIFNAPDWAGAPLIPDDQPTINPTAKSPKSAVAAVASMIDSLALNAIISDPATAKASIVAEINDQNPKRLDVVFTIQLSGNTNIIAINFNFGFFFGTPAIAA